MIGQLVVGRISVHVDPQTRRETPRTALHLRAAELLARSDLAPTTIPPSAILIVRRLADPLPHSLALQRVQAPSCAWERAVRNEIDILYRQAARPQRGKIAHPAGAVLFADEAELVACLILDLCEGVADMYWWWETLLGQQSPLSAAALLMHHARHIPGVFHLLDRWGRSLAVTQSLAAHETKALLTILLAAFQVTDFRASLQSGPDGAPVPRRVHAAGMAIESSDHEGENPAGVPSLPWAQWLPQAGSCTLTAEQAALLGTALALCCKGSTVRSQGFATVAAAWWQAVHADVAGRPPSIGIPPIAGEVSLRSFRGGAQEAGTPTPSRRERVRTMPAGSLHDAALREHPTGLVVDSTHLPVAQDSTGAAQNSFTDRTDPSQAQLSTTAEKPSDRELSTGRTAESWAEPGPGQGTVTGLGGVLYLINVMSRLGLPADFEDSWELASRVGPWAVLEILARGLLAGTGSAYLSDPLWRALARLDGREPELTAGEGLTAYAVRRLPPSWDATAPGLAVEGNDDAPTALTATLQPAVRQWLALLLPYIRSWLRHTLIAGPDVADQALIEMMLCRLGRLFVTITHVDLVLSLEQIWMPVRLAGLDQDPGWLPLWGRVVQFHFREQL